MNTSKASRRDADTRYACAAMRDDDLADRLNIDHALVIAGKHVSLWNLRAALRMRRELVRQSLRRSA